MKYKQLIANPKKELTLYDDHISVECNRFFGNYTQTNYEYGALTTTVSKALIRRDLFYNYVWSAVLVFMVSVLFFFNEDPLLPMIRTALFAIGVTLLVIAFLVRKRIPFLIFHNHEGTVLFDIGGDSEEYDLFIAELKKRIIQGQRER